MSQVMQIQFRNGKRLPVSDIREAQNLWNVTRDRSGKGVSEIGNGVLVLLRGRYVARVSYNGRIHFGKSAELPAEDVTA